LIDLLDDLEDTTLVSGVPLSCRGARCGACRVRVVRGENAIIAPRADELDTLRILGAGPDERLACQLQLRADGQRSVELVFTALTLPGSPRDAQR
jgi:ferredoxin